MKIYLGNKGEEVLYEDLAKMDNLLISGASGGGKTVYLSRTIKELTKGYSKDKLKFLIYDGKCVDYVKFKNSEYLLYPITNEESVDDFQNEMKDLKKIQDERILSKENEPTIIVLIDMSCPLKYSYKNFENDILEFLKETKKSNIHFIISVQSPNGISKEFINAFDNKIAYMMFNKDDSKRFIGISDAEKIDKSGDALLLRNGKIEKIHQELFDNKYYL